MDIIESVTQLVMKIGPAIGEAAFGAVRVDACSDLASSVVSFGLAGALVIGAKCCFKAQPTWDDAWFIPPRLIGCAGLVLAAGIASIGLWQWLDPWTWTMLNHPDLWLAKRALHI